MALKRVFSGFYKRYDGKPIFVVRVLKDIDTGESIVVCKDASFAKEDNEHYYLIRYTSFCEQVEVDGVLRDKYVRQTRREIDESTVREVYEDGFPEPKSKPLTYVDDEYVERAIRCSRTYYEYAKDICENYRMDLRRYKLIRERKQYIGVSNRQILDNLCRLADSGAEVIVRVPLIHNVNDSVENITRTAELAAAHGIREIDLLPFHRLGESKYAVIQQPYTMPDATVPQEHIDALAALLRQRGFIVSIGG